MKTIHFFALILFSITCNSQLSKDKNALFHFVIDQQLNIGETANTHKVLFINKLPHPIAHHLSIIDGLTVDTLSKSTLSMLSIQTYKKVEYLDYIAYNPDIKQLLRNFKNNYTRKHKAKVQEIEANSIIVQEISSHCFRKLFRNKRKNPYERMKKKFGTTLVVAFSNIEFHKEYAAFYYEHYCGSLCGVGNLIIMKKEDNKWDIASEINLWMS